MRRASVRKLIVLICLFAASAASAQALPNFDIQRRCLRLAMTPNVPTESVYYGCVASEQAAYGQLYHWWDDVASGAKAQCVGAARGSYERLQFCIDSLPETSQ
jgi:hypothetical protein